MTQQTTEIAALEAELAEISASFETATPGQILTWAHERFGSDLVLACSFQDIVLLDLAVKADPSIEVVFLDTEAHFPETLSYVDEVVARYDLNLTVTKPGEDAANTPCGSEGCCKVRKVGPLKRAVEGRAAWLTSVKRVDAVTRTETPIVSWDANFGLVKINPLATWTDADVASYEQTHDLPIHPLIPQGYLSIGCAPTTRPVAPGEDPRAGRWSDSDKIECGLHE
jgi:phosphoadenosine phosphosulfate reductase